MEDFRALTTFSETVESIYDAALNPVNWPEVTARIASLQDSDKAVLFALSEPGKKPDFAFAAGIPGRDMVLWETRYASQDIWMDNAVRKGMVREGEIMTNEDLVTDQEFLASTFYLEFLKHLNIGKLLCGCIFDGQRPGLPMSVCSVYRSGRDAPFDQHQRDMHQLTTRHLSNAMGTMFRLRDAEMRIASSLAALQRVPGAIILVGEAGAVHFANPAAEAIFRAHDGLGVRPSAGAGLGQLVVPDAADQNRLYGLLASATTSRKVHAVGHFSDALRIRKSGGEDEYILQISALGRQNEYSAAQAETRAIVFIADTGASYHLLDAEVLKRAYGLTPAEIAVSQELIKADGVPEIASRMNLSVTTVRSHLKSIFSKTQSDKQTQLLKLLLSFRRIE